MLRPSFVIALAFYTVGLFLVSLGNDAHKTAPLGIRYAPIVAVTAALPVRYAVVALSTTVLGVALIVVSAYISSRVDQRITKPVPGVKTVPSFVTVMVPGTVIALLAWGLLDRSLQR
jgi:ABC-type dipeptide/oligopeptide/nickel transport system permease subunit